MKSKHDWTFTLMWLGVFTGGVILWAIIFEIIRWVFRWFSV